MIYWPTYKQCIDLVNTFSVLCSLGAMVMLFTSCDSGLNTGV